MKIVNPGRFQVKVGDLLEYNPKAIIWLNNIRKKKGTSLLRPAKELDKENPKVVKMEIDNLYKSIELWVEHDTTYTGITGVVDGSFIDIWFLFLDGRFVKACPHLIFKVKK
jgi:hypothetical protein